MVTVKATHEALEVWMEERAEYAALKFAIAKKFDANARFYIGATLPVVMYGKVLSALQKRELKKMFADKYSLMEVIFVDEHVVQSETKRPEPRQILSALSSDINLVSKIDEELKSLFVHKSLVAGQRIQSEGDVVVLGDIGAGAEVIAAGNIAVFGRIIGLAHAGFKGRTDVCIVAGKFNPGQIRIANKIGVISRMRSRDGTRVARIIDEKIVISELDA